MAGAAATNESNWDDAGDRHVAAALPRVLVADDDEILLEIASAKLREEGWDVFAVKDGLQALNHLRANAVDLVVSDLDMPEINGYGLMEKMQAEPALKATPVIVITGNEDTQAVERSFEAGAVSFIAKPINWALFSRQVRFVHRASQAEAELRVAKEQVESASRLKDTLFSRVRHELQTPLNTIVGFAVAMKKEISGPLGDDYRGYVDMMLTSGEDLSAKLDAILFCAGLHSGVIKMNEEEWSLSDALDAARAERTSLAVQRGVTLAPLYERDEHTAIIDGRLVRRAFLELLDNAVRHAPSGSNVRVGLANTCDGAMALYVEDAGPGIPKDRILDIVQSFRQAETGFDRSEEGLGLGLSIAARVAALHDGELRFETPEDGGARVMLVLPRRRIVNGVSHENG